MAEQSGIARLESFPFDSKADGYDADGYPVYDRAAGALLLRKTYEKFFTDGVFGTPADALQIAKGDSGLYITVKPGIFIIKGAMGGVIDDDLSILLDTAAPQGNIAYGVMLHYDENDTANTGRSLSIRIVRGDASASAQPPAPDQSTPGIYEYRLGYVTVPSGATDLSAAVVTNEKGTGTCPYAAPFDTIDVSGIVEDARDQAQEEVDAFLVYAQQYYDLIASAIDDTTAGYLMEMINNISTASFVDNVTLNLNKEAKAQIKSRAVKDDLIGIYGIHSEHMDNYLRQLLGILDPSSWEFQKYLDYISDLSEEDQADFISGNVTQDTVESWTAQQIVQLDGVLKGVSASAKLTDLIDPGFWSWSDLATISGATQDKSSYVGKSKSASFGSHGTIQFLIIGGGHDTVVGGSTKAGLTFMTAKAVGNRQSVIIRQEGTGWNYSSLRTLLASDWLPQAESGLAGVIKTVSKQYSTGTWSWTGGPGNITPDSLSYASTEDKLFIPSAKEITSTHTYWISGSMGAAKLYGVPSDGTTYEFWAKNQGYKVYDNKTPNQDGYWTRSFNGNFVKMVGDNMPYDPSHISIRAYPFCFCI